MGNAESKKVEILEDKLKITTDRIRELEDRIFDLELHNQISTDHKTVKTLKLVSEIDSLINESRP